MASKLESWWSGSYPAFSMKHYETWLIYNKLISAVSAEEHFTKTTETGQEAYWVIDNCDIYEWFDSTSQTGEKFGHDKNSDTWFYEHWFVEEGIHIVAKTWHKYPHEWGVVIKYLPDHEVHTTWELGPIVKSFEESTKIGDVTNGTKQCVRCTPEGLEDYTEKFWSDPTSSGKEKVWTLGTSRGEEKEYQEGDKKWGESWKDDPDFDFNEKKEWKQEGDKYTGLDTGKKGDLSWEEKREKTPEHESQEKTWTRGDKKWGFVKDKKPDQAYKMDWEGKKPEVGTEGAKAAVAMERAKMVVPLTDLFRKQKAEVDASQDTLKSLVAMTPDLQEEAAKLADAISALEDPNFDDPLSIVAKLNELTDLQNKLEDLKQKSFKGISDQSVTSAQLNKILDADDAIVSALLPIIKPDRVHPFLHEHAGVKKDRENAVSLQDGVHVNDRYQNLAKSLIKMIGVGTFDGEETPEETQAINNKLARPIKELADTLHKGESTLDKIEANYKPNDEITQQIRAGQHQRLAEIDEGIASGQRYNILIDQIFRLARDQEDFKRELMGEDLVQKIADISAKDAELAKELAVTLEKPELPIIKTLSELEVPNQLAPQVEKLGRWTNVLRALLGKLIGMDDDTANEDNQEINDSIKKRGKGECVLPYDPVTLLKFLLVNGKITQDAVSRNIKDLAEGVGDESDQEQANEVCEQGINSVTGVVPDTAREALITIKTTIEELFPAISNEEELLEFLIQKSKDAVSQAASSGGAGGRRPKAVRVRSKKGAGPQSAIDITDLATESVKDSFETLEGMGALIYGSKPNIDERVSELRKFKDEVNNNMQENRTNMETVSDVFNVLNDLEKEKREFVMAPDIFKNLYTTLNKAHRLVDNGSKFFNVPVPPEVEELKDKPAENLADLTKRIGYIINVYFRMTGLPEDDENVDAAVAALTKKQTAASLPFDPVELLHSLRMKKDNDTDRLLWLAGLVGSDEQLAEAKDLVNSIHEAVHDEIPDNNTRALELLDDYLKTYPELEKEVERRLRDLLDQLMVKLREQEPSEDEIKSILTTLENLNLASKKLYEKASVAEHPELDTLVARKDKVPTEPHQLMPYYTELAADWSEFNLNEITKDGPPVTDEEARQVHYGVSKKMKLHPVVKLREIKPFFAGPDHNDVAKFIVYLNKAVGILSQAHPHDEQALIDKCSRRFEKLTELTPKRVGRLATRYSKLILRLLAKLLEKPVDEVITELEDQATTTVTQRTGSKTFSTVLWTEILKGQGLDVNAELICEAYNREQAMAIPVIEAMTKYFGTPDNKVVEKNLKAKSEDVLKEDHAPKIEHYAGLRLEQSRLVMSLNDKVMSVLERLRDIDSDKARTVKGSITETEMVIPEGEDLLKAQLNLFKQKEDEYSAQELDNVVDLVLRLLGRINLERELQKLRDAAKPKDNREAETIEMLRAIEEAEFKSIKGSYSTLQTLVSQLFPSLEADITPLKALTDPSGVATTIPQLASSILGGFDNANTIEQKKQSLLNDTPIKGKLADLIKLIAESASADDTETDTVFAGLFRLCGSSDDKAQAKDLKEARALQQGEPNTITDSLDLVSTNISKLLPSRQSQTKLQSKLVKEAGGLRSSIDDVDIQTEDLLKKAIRETANTISSDDAKTKDALDKVKKAIEKIEEESPANMPEVIQRVTDRLDQWEKLERLRKDLRERLSKEINRLKGDVQDKLNELQTTKATFEGQKVQYEAQIHLLQNSVEQNSKLVEKLTQESADKETVISELKIKVADATNEIENLKEEMSRTTEELDDANKELRNIRRVNKEKDTQIRDLQNSLDQLQRSSEKNFQGDKEKLELLDALKNDLRQAREELAAKSKHADELEDIVKAKDREIQKLTGEKAELEEKLAEQIREKNELKLHILKLETERNELEEKLKLGQAGNPEEIAYLEHMLEDKDKALNELEEQLESARRYQQLYALIKEEKEEQDTQIKSQEIDLSDLQRRIKELTSENENLKYKTRQVDKLQKDVAALQKENQNLKHKIDYLEEFSGDKSSDVQEAINKMTAEIAQKENQISELNDTIDKLRTELLGLHTRHSLAMNRNFLIRFINSYKNKQQQYFRTWMSKKTIKGDSHIVVATSTIEIPDNVEEKEKKHYEAAAIEMQEDNKTMIECNAVTKAIREAGIPNEKPISYLNVFKFLEDLMDKKFEADRKDLSERKTPKPMPDFLMEHLNKTFGISKLAMKHLAGLLPALDQLFSEGNKYAAFYCRLLQMFHPDPVPSSLSVYLVRARVGFHPLIDKLERTRQNQGKKASGPKGKASGRAAFEAAGTGGVALLSDVIELLYTMFMGDREMGTLALEYIKPEAVSHEDFVAYKICHKMAKLGKTPEAIFNMLDKDAGGTIDANEFISGTKEDLDLWISDENINKLMRLLDTRGNGEITKESFMAKINMKNLMEWNRSEDWVVSKASYLVALIDVYKAKQRKDTAFLFGEYEAFGTEGVNAEQFKSAALKYDPCLSDERVAQIWAEASQGNDSIGPKLFVKTITKYGIGGYGFGTFLIRELMDALAEAKAEDAKSQA
ncbi:unnamed protein product [Blepharisma stoltei]|uniref:EF-hand domain-containing protein n=1 Tax=Blepharisma stoltei TaxID=1481888 RepID=A0AAU9JTE2_9CILI|nr:unnamed protein product [Blepharisma stoltei]